MNTLQRIEQLEKELAELKAQHTAAPSLLTKPMPGSGAAYWGLRASTRRGFCAEPSLARVTDPAFYNHGYFFQSKALSDAYAEAIDTMLLLRHQPGTVSAKAGDTKYLIRTELQGEEIVITNADGDFTDLLCPAFSTEAHAKAAIDTLGADRILRMFKVLHHVDD